MKKDVGKSLKEAFILGFAGWYLRMKYWKARIDAWERGEVSGYWKAEKRRRRKKYYWWEKVER